MSSGRGSRRQPCVSRLGISSSSLAKLALRFGVCTGRKKVSTWLTRVASSEFLESCIPFTWSKTFSIFLLAPRALTPRSSSCLSSSSMSSIHLRSFRFSVYLCSRRLLSHAGMSWSRVGSVGSSGGLELPRRPLGDLPLTISEWSDKYPSGGWSPKLPRLTAGRGFMSGFVPS